MGLFNLALAIVNPGSDGWGFLLDFLVWLGFFNTVKTVICLESMEYHFLHFFAAVLWHWSPERKLYVFKLVNSSFKEQHNHVSYMSSLLW